MCLQIAKLKQLDIKGLFIGAFANTYYSAGTGRYQTCCGKNDYTGQFRPKTPLVFFRKKKNFGANLEFTFRQTSTSFSQ